jgi:hypothetical protein
MTKRLPPSELIKLVENVIHPAGKGFTSEQTNQQLFEFCINCPDPAGAMDILLDAPRGSTSEGIVERALARPPRDPNTLPESELAKTHPLRHMKLED